RARGVQRRDDGLERGRALRRHAPRLPVAVRGDRVPPRRAAPPESEPWPSVALDPPHRTERYGPSYGGGWGTLSGSPIDYQTRQGCWRGIAEPSGQEKAALNSGRLERGPLTRKRPGECGSVWARRRAISSLIL